MTTSTIATHNINIESYGSGDRRVLALHCSLGRAASWKAIANILADDVTLLAPDWPGHGKSAPWNESGLMRFAARDITEALIGEDSVDLVGHSYGGLVALEFATRHPEKVRSLTLIEPIYLAIVGQDNRPSLDRYLAQMQPHFDALAQDDNEVAAKIFMDIWGGGVTWEQLPAAAQAGLIQQIPVVDACKPGEETSPEDIATIDLLPRLTMPVKVIFGSQTLPIVKQVMQGLSARLPDAEMVEIAGAGHMVPLTHSSKVAAEIAATYQQSRTNIMNP